MTERMLPEEDHGNLYVASSFGIFAATLERAAAHFGWKLEVQRCEELEVSELHRAGPRVRLGQARIVGAMPPEPHAPLFEARRTSRLPYHDRPIAPEALASFQKTVEAAGQRLLHYDAPDVVQPLLLLNAQAIIDNLQLEREREEIRGWYRLGRTPEYGDGLFRAPMNQPAWELWAAFAMPSLFRREPFKSFAIRRYLATQRGTRHVALLCGRFREWPDLFVAGRMLFELWLELARFDVYMQPMGSMLTNPAYSAEIARRFGRDDCWLVLRLGYSEPPPRAPRLENILLDA
ncbi:MAG TPA: hypothetical protein VFQ61_39485 [Polyangiaceae bacterium]|nr:hypothetical protein [Polyangiaceae bacterium]